MSLQTNISYGEFLDKMTILDIKSERIKDDEKLVNINHEREILKETWEKHGKFDIDISNEY